MQQRFAILMAAAGFAATAACSQTDAGITTAVTSKLAADDTVKASEINVDTHNHVVTLNGRVESRIAKERASQIARDTNGVSSVVDDLVVGPVPEATSGRYDRNDQTASDKAHDAKVNAEDKAHDAKTTTERATAKSGEALSDAAITSEVKTKFLAEPGVSGLSIDVDTHNGVVTLSGMVKSKAEATKAMAMARESKGVKRVVSKLKVQA
jgi:osmotically-inducible protein OsmY